jgi:hypothetical protein
MSRARELTAAEITFIRMVEDSSSPKSSLSPEAFVNSTHDLITKGVSRQDQARIGFGEEVFIAEFQRKLIDTQKLSTQTIFGICSAFLLDGKYRAFLGDPIRSAHLFSNLYGELVRRHDLNLDGDPAAIVIPKEIAFLNHGVLDYFKRDLFINGGNPEQTLANDLLQKSHTRKKAQVDATSADSLGGIIDDNVASPELVRVIVAPLQEKPADIPQEYFDALPKNSPVPDKKKVEESPHIRAMKTQYHSRSASSPVLFKKPTTNEGVGPVKPTSASSPARLEGEEGKVKKPFKNPFRKG